MKEIEKQFWMEGQQFFLSRERVRSKENEREDAVEKI